MRSGEPGPENVLVLPNLLESKTAVLSGDKPAEVEVTIAGIAAFSGTIASVSIFPSWRYVQIRLQFSDVHHQKCYQILLPESGAETAENDPWKAAVHRAPLNVFFSAVSVNQ